MWLWFSAACFVFSNTSLDWFTVIFWFGKLMMERRNALLEKIVVNSSVMEAEMPDK
jgi:hypothetical protein